MCTDMRSSQLTRLPVQQTCFCLEDGGVLGHGGDLLIKQSELNMTIGCCPSSPCSISVFQHYTLKESTKSCFDKVKVQESKLRILDSPFGLDSRTDQKCATMMRLISGRSVHQCSLKWRMSIVIGYRSFLHFCCSKPCTLHAFLQ